MPKEFIKRSNQDCFADLQVMWGKDQNTVRLFMISKDGLDRVDGSFWFEPNEHSSLFNPESPEDKCGPVDVNLDRQQINRLITVLRRARNSLYGQDE